MSSVNHYEVLGVQVDADVPTIERAFRKLSLRLHPDKANAATTLTGRPETLQQRQAREAKNYERFAQILNSRDTLTDPKKRHRYDSERTMFRSYASSSGFTESSYTGRSSASSRTSEFRKLHSSTSSSRYTQPSVSGRSGASGRTSELSRKPSSFASSSGFNQPRPYQERTGSQSQSNYTTSQSLGKRLDVQLANDPHVNHFRNLISELTEMQETVQRTDRILPYETGYLDYSEVVSGFSKVISATKEIRKCIDDAKGEHLRDPSSTAAREAYRSAITRANTHCGKLQTLFATCSPKSVSLSRLGISICTRPSSSSVLRVDVDEDPRVNPKQAHIWVSSQHNT